MNAIILRTFSAEETAAELAQSNIEIDNFYANNTGSTNYKLLVNYFIATDNG